MTIEQALQRLQAAKVRHLPLSSLKTDEALQPREERMVPFREQQRVGSRSEEHIGTLVMVLRASSEIQLEPVLVADIEGCLYLVDGHHRLKAYQRTQREALPARVMPMGRRQAVLVSKLVNCSNRALEMHVSQRRDAAWQYVAAVTKHGTRELPEGESLRTVSRRFGISHETARTMLRKVPKVNPRRFPAVKLDPGTGFPRWKAVVDWRNHGEDEMEDQPMNAERWTQWEAERVAKKLGALETGTTQAAWKLALQMYATEAKQEAGNEDTLSFLAEIAEPSSEDF